MVTTVDRFAGVRDGLGRKAPARVATTANITLGGLQTIDGVVLAEGDRVLVWQQSSAIENGVYDASSGNWTRTKDFDGNRDVVQGTGVVVADGLLYARKEFILTTANPIVIDTSSISFLVFNDLAGVRDYLVSATTLYVRTDGNDTNTGLVNSAAGAFLTLQAAWNWAAARDNRGYDITVRVQAGTYTAGLLATYPLTGGGKFIVTNDAAITLNAPYSFASRYGAAIEVRPNGTHLFEVRATASSGIIMSATYFGRIIIGAGITYGQGHATAIHNYASRFGYVEIENGCTITGGGDDWAQASHSGNIRLAAGTLTIGANITFTGSFLYSLTAADITATGGLTVDYGIYTVSAIRWRVRGAEIQWVFAYGGRDGPPGNSPGLEYEGGTFMEGVSPYGSAPADAGQLGDCEMGSFTADMSILSSTVVPIAGLDWMPARIEFEIACTTCAGSYGRGTWIRSKNSNYGMSLLPSTSTAVPSAVASLYFLATDTTGFTGTVTAWSTYSFAVTLTKFSTPTGTATIQWKAFRR